MKQINITTGILLLLIGVILGIAIAFSKFLALFFFLSILLFILNIISFTAKVLFIISSYKQEFSPLWVPVI